MGIDPFYPDWFNWQMGWALYYKNDCAAALTAMRKMSRIQNSAHARLLGFTRVWGTCGRQRKRLRFSLRTHRANPISKQRKQWEKVDTAPGALERWLNHMRIAGLPE